MRAGTARERGNQQKAPPPLDRGGGAEDWVRPALLVVLHHAGVAAVKRQVAVVHLQRQQAQRRRAEPPADVAVTLETAFELLDARRVLETALLAVHQHGAKAGLAVLALVPVVPRVAA